MAKVDKEQGGAGPEALTGVGMAFMEGWAEASSQVATFLARRIQSDFQLQREILQCRDPAELVRIQTAFVQKAIEDYRTEGSKLAQIGTGIADAALRRKRG